MRRGFTQKCDSFPSSEDGPVASDVNWLDLEEVAQEKLTATPEVLFDPEEHLEANVDEESKEGYETYSIRDDLLGRK